MNVLLVYPKYPDTFWSFKHVLPFVKKKAAFPPLGLLTIASMLPREWNLRLIDWNVEELKNEDILWADMIMVSAMIVQKKSAQEIISKSKNLGKKVVAGGPVFTAQHEKFERVDHFILGEAEISLPLFIKDLEAGNPKQIYKPDFNIWPDLTLTPLPMWSLIDLNNYVTMLIQHSRGCPRDCEFCDITVTNGRVPRCKTVAQIIAELDALYKAGWTGSVFWVDDNFIGNVKQVLKMLPAVIQWQIEHKFPFKFLTEATVDLADKEGLMKLMSRANFFKVFLGLETPSMASLKECNKRHNIRDLAKTVRIIHQHGMQVMGGFIVGFDNDTESIFDAQIKFIQQIGVVTAMVGLLNALPNTRLWHRLKKEKRLLNDFSGANTDGSINFIPIMKLEQLVAGYKKILSTIYSPSIYYERITTFVNHYQPTVKGQIQKESIYAFVKSIWTIGVLSKARFYYWKLLFRVSFTKIKALPIAVELAIFGLHFEKVSRAICGDGDW
jgi:radical SAM superfamily enzyme YgiQ (UPF0313 family)